MFPQVVYLPNRTRFILSFAGVSLASYPEFYFDGRVFTNGSEKIEVTSTIRHVASSLQEHVESLRSLYQSDTAPPSSTPATSYAHPTPHSLEALTAQVASDFSPSRGLDVQYLPGISP